MRLSKRHLLILCKAALDCTVILFGFQTAYLLQILAGVHDFQAGAAWFRLQISVLYAVLFILSAERLELYKTKSSLFNLREKAGLFRAIFTTTVLFLAVNGLLNFIYSSWDFIITSGVVLLFLSVVRHFLFKRDHKKYLEGRHERKILIYGAGEAGNLLFKKMYFMEGGDYSLVGFLDDTMAQGAELTLQRSRSKARPFTARVLGGFKDLGRLVREHNIYQVIIAIPSAPVDRIMEIMRECIRSRVGYSFVPHLYKLRLEQVDARNIGDIPLLQKREFHLSFHYLLAKRLMDIVFSAGLLLCLLPLFPVIALLIKATSVGPVFFRQKRVGKEGRLFNMYKFRTMSMETPAYMPSPSNNAPSKYVGRVGSFLRDTNLDEIPQLWNVLKGEMSVVGPRPEMPFHVEKYDEVQRDRLRVTPGLTGPWQISPDRDKEIHDNIDYDLYYINNQSFFVDLILVIETSLLTAVAIVKKIRGTFLKRFSAPRQNKESSSSALLPESHEAPTLRRTLPS